MVLTHDFKADFCRLPEHSVCRGELFEHTTGVPFLTPVVCEFSGAANNRRRREAQKSPVCGKTHQHIFLNTKPQLGGLLWTVIV